MKPKKPQVRCCDPYAIDCVADAVMEFSSDGPNRSGNPRNPPGVMGTTMWMCRECADRALGDMARIAPRDEK